MDYDTIQRIERTGGLLLYMAVAGFSVVLTTLLLAGGQIPLAAVSVAVCIAATAMGLRHQRRTAHRASSGPSVDVDDERGHGKR